MKRALVISGGGSKGAFAVGVLQRLRRLFPALHFDLVVGTSTGAPISLLAALEETDLLEHIYTTQTTATVVTKHRLGDRLNQKSIYTVEPLWQLIKTHLTDTRYHAVVESNKAIYIVTTCLQTKGTVVYTTNPAPHPSPSYSLKTVRDAEHLRLAVLGSACQPVFMTPVMIDFNYTSGQEKHFQYVDGGVREYAGVQMAMDQGATEIFCILLSTGKPETADVPYQTLFPILERTISMFSEDVEKNDIFIPEQYAKFLRYLGSVKQNMQADGISQNKIEAYFDIAGSDELFAAGQEEVKLFIIRPDAPLGGGPGGLVFNPTEMQNMLTIGSNTAQNFAAKLAAKDITWLV